VWNEKVAWTWFLQTDRDLKQMLGTAQKLVEVGSSARKRCPFTATQSIA